VNKLIRDVTKEFVPGVPAIPARPAYCYEAPSVGASQAGLGSVGGSSVTEGTPAWGNFTRYNGFIVPIYQTLTREDGSTYQVIVGYTSMRGAPSPAFNPVYTAATSTACLPAIAGVPGVPPQVTRQNAGPDWRASARSISKLSGDVTATFNVSPYPHTIVGFGNKDNGPNQGDIKMGVFLATDNGSTFVRPIIDGVEQTSVGSYLPNDKVELTRVHGSFTIRVGGALLYSGLATTEDAVFLDSMLYTEADYVDNPTFVQAQSIPIAGSVGLSPVFSSAFSAIGSVGITGKPVGSLVDGDAALQVTGSVGLAAQSSVIATQNLLVSGSVGLTGVVPSYLDYTSAALTLGALAMQAADYAVTNGVIVLPTVAMEAYGGTAGATVAGGDEVLPKLVTTGVMYTGGLITGGLNLGGLSALASENTYAGVAVTLTAMLCYGDDGFGVPNYYGHNDDLQMSSFIDGDPTIVAIWQDGLDIEPSMTLAVVANGSMFDGLLLDESLSVEDIVNALIESGVNLSTATRVPLADMQQLAFNIATGAATRYDNFEFTQFVRTDEGTFGIKKDGVYRLREGDDAGNDRTALVDFGATAFGTSKIKHIHNIYLGLSGDGTVYVKLKDDGNNERTYRVSGSTPSRKVNPGKNRKGREWSVRLEWVDSTAIELESVEFVIAGSGTRRIG